jgi:hypothetical protein
MLQIFYYGFPLRTNETFHLRMKFSYDNLGPIKNNNAHYELPCGNLKFKFKILLTQLFDAMW